MALLMVAVSLFSGCVAYEPQPLGLSDHLDALRDRDTSSTKSPALLRPAVEAALTLLPPHLAAPATPPAAELPLADAERLALLLNPDVRLARVRAVGRAATVAFAGLLDDPILDTSVLRVVENVEEPWIFGAGIGFTIPLSGRLGLERDLVGAEAGAAWRRAVEVELETLLGLRSRWLAWSAARQRVAMLETYLRAMEPVRTVASRLVEVGEVGPTEARLLEIEAASRRAELVAARWEAAQARVVVLETMGLLPTAPVDLAPVDLDRAVETDEPPPAPPARAVQNHPIVLAATAVYESAERRLRLEVGRQYPDLVIGPLYEHEENQSRIGLGLSLLPIPVFNRNRRGIAEAEAARNVARVEAEAAVEELAASYASARARLIGAVDRLRVLEEDVLPLIEEQREAVRRLAELGELDALMLADVFRASLEQRRQILDARLEAALAGVVLDVLLAPPTARPGSAASRSNHERSNP